MVVEFYHVEIPSVKKVSVTIRTSNSRFTGITPAQR